MPATPAESSQELRQRAEDLFRASETLIPEMTSPEETKRLFHELRVHQIQLEMQNEELRRAHEDLDASNSRFCDLYDLAPVGYLTISAKRMIKEVNIAAADLFGIVRSLLVKEPISRILPIEGQYPFYQHLKQCSEAGEAKDLEIRLVRGDGALFWAHLQVTPAQNGEYWITISDITERKQAEEALNENQQRLAGIIEGTRVGTWEWNIQTGETVCNARWAEIIGYTLKEIAPVSIKTWLKYAHPEDLQKSGELLEKHFRGEVAYYHYETRMKHKDGRWIWVLDRGKVATWSDDGKPLWMFGTHQDITERKQMEAELRESEQRFRNMFRRHSAVMFLVKPESGAIVDANEAAAHFYGYTRERLLKMNIIELNTLDPDQVADERNKALREERNYFIFPHKLSSGEIRTVEVHSTPIEGNNKPLLFSIIHDITERKHAEAKIAQLSEEQSIVLGHAGVGISFVQNRYQKWSNSCMAEIFGYTPEEMVNANLRIFYASEEDYEQIGREAYPVLASGESFAKKLQMRRSDGTLFPARIIGKAVNSANISDGSIWILSDETLQYELEQKLQQSHDLLASLSRQIPGTIYQYQLFPDGRSCFPYASDAIIDMYEVTPDDVREDAAPVFNNLHPDDLGGVSESIMESARTLEPWAYDYRVKLPQKGVQWRHGFSRPQRLNDGSTLWHGFINDITAQKKLEFDLAEARNAAESASRAKSEFLANMSHEIRTPMNGLLGMTQLLEMTALTEEQQEYMVALKLSGKNLVLLVNDILDLSKIEAGKITIEPVEFSLRHAINDVYLMQKSFIFGKKLSFNITVAEDIPTVIIGDQQRFKQILLNLLGNAAKFTKSGGITIAAEVLERHNDCLTIQFSVADTGIGISSAALEKIFNPFVQEDGSSTRPFGGTGLGLTISRRLAELMGGAISVESSQGVGSSFILTLPFIIPAVQQTTDIREYPAVPLWTGASLRILIVEDNPVNLLFETVLLGKHGHEVVTAENGREGLEALDKGAFDLVLMDVQMPVMNGEAALRAIRVKEQGTSCHQKVIALTAYALRNEKERFLSEGFDGYLSKPMGQQELIDEMKRVMNI